MSTTLLEADFITIDISNAFKKPQVTKSSDNEANNDANKANQSNSEKEQSDNINWATELEKRLNDNQALSPNARKTNAEIEDQFWLEFFTAHWGEELANILTNILQLRIDIKKLRFETTKNPIVAFLSLSYVKENLIKSRLVNSSTYRVIHNAMAAHWVADSEFYAASSYNILYCRDLYSKSISEMEDYLKLQKKEPCLPTAGIKVYDVERQNRNKEIFLKNGTSMLDANAKLKSLEEIRKVLGVGAANNNTESEEETSGVSKSTIVKLVNSINSLAQAQAALQYIVMNNQNTEAYKILRSSQFNSVSNEALVKATVEVASFLKNTKFSKEEATVFANLVADRVREF